MHVQQDGKPTFEGMADPVGPFGNPDGSRAPIENVLSQFVDFHGNPVFKALRRLAARSERQPDRRRHHAEGRRQNGLLGYVEADGETRFYSHAEMDHFDIPMDADGYVFHPSVVDSVGIRQIGDPVYPFGRRRP